MTPITDCALPTCVSVGTLLDDDIYFQDRSAIIAAFPRFRSVAEKARESRIAIEFTGNTKK